ncbi:hypothetical protein EXIGLDRAFT_832007 [Exidia glandulosa HHB12029]|uniref:HNH nuclease domain-containing protein n=1 Tax=Exidia glandulosa HHB12029 TaxID=1314781 RepID=A0A165M5H8_EXIGL|nr:hypothetical protein EXIGLDRAFT_832007 [Exidia glandulosa HHB12029]
METKRPQHNVVLYGTDFAAKLTGVIGGFYTYGDTAWSSMYSWLIPLLVPVPPSTSADLRFFEYDPDKNVVGPMLADGATSVQRGAYIMRDVSGGEVLLGTSFWRGRAPVSTPRHLARETKRLRAMALARDDETCMVAHDRISTTRLMATRIFTPSFDGEWTAKNFPAQETINPVQTVLTLRSDLHCAWNMYDFGVDIHDNYKIIYFSGGCEDVQGHHLKLDHIVGPAHRPLDVLLEDHFKQCVHTCMSASEVPYYDAEDFKFLG